MCVLFSPDGAAFLDMSTIHRSHTRGTSHRMGLGYQISSAGLWAAACMAVIALLITSAIIIFGGKSKRKQSSLNLAPCTPEVIQPGLVLLRGVLPLDTQLWIAEQIFKYGHVDRKLWKPSEDSEGWELNNARQGRGRIYDALRNYPHNNTLHQLCTSITALAQTADACMPSIDPTHLLVLYYSTPRKLGWHRDNGKQDGQSLSPVVSISLGNDCSFLIKNEPTDESREILLQSGDVILFGGPSRNILHTVHTIYTSTCPPSLLELHHNSAATAPDTAFGASPPACFRMNLTFRHAPELFGHENDDRFYYFAKSQRTFIETAKEVGIEEARRIVNERRAAKAARKAKKE